MQPDLEERAVARFDEVLAAECARLQLPLSRTRAGALSGHYRLLRRWAPKVNLTTVLEPEDAAIRHGVDSLLFHTVLPERLPDLVDVGTGAGFPGIALAICRPETRVTLVEPIRKRTSFLRSVVAALDLPSVTVVEGRLEPSGPLPEGFLASALVSRATWEPSAWIRMGARGLAPGGLLVTSAGRGAPEPSALAQTARQVGLAPLDRRTFRLSGDLVRVLDLFHRPD